MEVKVNDKSFMATWPKGYGAIIGNVHIVVRSEEDVIFFLDWMEKVGTSIWKKDYAIDIGYRDGDECDVLIGCWPFSGPCEFSGDKNDIVEVSYDFNKRT